MENVANPCNVRDEEKRAGGEKPKVVVVLGPTGSGKSRLAMDLASHFPIEIINADSMQVYRGLDVLTNKLPLRDQKGVPHHLLGTISPNFEFTAKDFRDSAIPLINEIVSRNNLPVIVGGTNYYIQALVSSFLVDDLADDTEECDFSDTSGDKGPEYKYDAGMDSLSYSYQSLKNIDPTAANRIHPNDYRKINQYLSLHTKYGVIPSKLFQGKTAENWGRANNFRFNSCFICVDASLSVLDRYVEQRVDCMVDSGLLSEVYDIYSLNADYTRGLRQAIGVREFEDFLRFYLSEGVKAKNNDLADRSDFSTPIEKTDKVPKLKRRAFLCSSSSIEDQHNTLLKESIDKVKANTRRLVRRQKRRLKRLQTLFGWLIHYVDSTDSLLGDTNSWAEQVVRPSVEIIKSFIGEDDSFAPDSDVNSACGQPLLVQKDLWTQYICEGCGNRVFRGDHEWEQHLQGRKHRKRISKLRRSQNSYTGKP